ncbi:MAG: BolA family transcriptional regulator [Thiotrichaceae bacterium]|nr:BolA family transcriptional regulator [Thiotrichaceae bacterium]
MTVAQIEEIITTSFKPEQLEILDNSQAHAGHAGVQNGGGHYHVNIVSKDFEGKTQVQRHQLIYQALGNLMKKEIHALGINASTPTEFKQRKI